MLTHSLLSNSLTSQSFASFSAFPQQYIYTIFIANRKDAFLLFASHSSSFSFFKRGATATPHSVLERLGALIFLVSTLVCRNNTNFLPSGTGMC